MKKLIGFIALLYLSKIIFCQSLSPEIISSSGDDNQGTEVSLSWTIGECLTESYTSGEYILNQGFQQSFYQINTLEENLSTDQSIRVYPVPTSDYIQVELKIEDWSHLKISLFNLEGKLILSHEANGPTSSINLQHLPPSEYILNVVDPKNNILKSVKIIKK
ncbi:MAG: T9SS type A sorting domain-containing protein [Bacteroidales bacterium]|nr:T9SS type A sorting domain-containing protein [Bacteroidales bacterium]